MKTQILQNTKQSLKLAAAHIQKGGVVAFATETVYGLGANALDNEAVQSIFTIKGRPCDNPLIVHLASVEDIERVAFINEKAMLAAQSFMPGALTLVLKKRDIVPAEVCAGLATVAVRVPQNQLARDFIRECNLPIAAPSANTSTRPSPTNAQHVLSDLDGKIKYILDGGSCQIGIESTILDVTTDTPRLLRAGSVTVEQLEKVLGKIEIYKHDSSKKPLCPGQMYRHYAPSCSVKVADSPSQFFGLIGELLAQNKKVIALCDQPSLGAEKDKLDAEKNNFGADLLLKNGTLVCFDSAERYAQRLFESFRRAEQSGADVVVCLLSKNQGIGASLNSRIKKAGGLDD